MFSSSSTADQGFQEVSGTDSQTVPSGVSGVSGCFRVVLGRFEGYRGILRDYPYLQRLSGKNVLRSRKFRMAIEYQSSYLQIFSQGLYCGSKLGVHRGLYWQWRFYH